MSHYGEPEVRPVLANRLETAMTNAWNETTKTEFAASDFAWRTIPISLPAAPHLNATTLQNALQNADATDTDRLAAASNLIWLQCCEACSRRWTKY